MHNFYLFRSFSIFEIRSWSSALKLKKYLNKLLIQVDLQTSVFVTKDIMISVWHAQKNVDEFAYKTL